MNLKIILVIAILVIIVVIIAFLIYSPFIYANSKTGIIGQNVSQIYIIKGGGEYWNSSSYINQTTAYNIANRFLKQNSMGGYIRSVGTVYSAGRIIVFINVNFTSNCHPVNILPKCPIDPSTGRSCSISLPVDPSNGSISDFGACS